MTDAANNEPLRARIIETCRAMNRVGLNQGTSGNLSARLDGERCLITPSGLDYDAMTPGDIALLSFDGRWSGRSRPSTEWRFHRDILRHRPDAGAVLHAHARHATAIACLGLDIPAFHYMVAVAGGDAIRCAPYATFGSQALSDAALAALDGRKACLLAHHGMIAIGETPEKALRLAIEVEALAAIYLSARQIGEPKTLPRGEMARVLRLFATYGTPDFPDDELRRIDER
ncbi:MAG: class II aldolase [Rhizobiales bacterium 65-9]|nr:class II aldolase/adducin family protein [Hyphomicrobiales bacterium]OJY33985.1 MAG: class II aldolase [Rhizobiales bacterium 65-9]